MRDQLEDRTHLHPPHASHAPIHPVLPVESPEGEDVSAALLQVARSGPKYFSTSHLLPLSEAAEVSLANPCGSLSSFQWRESEHVIINLEQGL